MPTKRILLIEDEDDIREVAAMSLESTAGWTVLAASSGKQGIEVAAREHPDAILLDVMMPDMDGPATLQQLLTGAETKAIPIIFMTAKVQTAEKKKLAELGARGIIAKPFDPLQLADEVSRLLGWQ